MADGAGHDNTRAELLGCDCWQSQASKAGHESLFAALIAGKRITPEEFTVYLKRAVWTRHKDPAQRIGQAYFNALRDDHPEIADDFRGGSLDPFYNDGLVPDFLAFLAQEYVR